jgi:hypothetical protein
MLLLGGGKSMMEAGLQELLLDSLFTYSLLILGSFLSLIFRGKQLIFYTSFRQLFRL